MIEIGGKNFELVVTKKKIRSLHLRLIDAQTIAVSCPHFTPQSLINKFIADNHAWILQASQKIIPPQPLLSLTTLTILDYPFKLIIRQTPRDSLVILDREIHLNLSVLSNLHAKKILNQKLAPYALKLIKQELVQLQSQFSFRFTKVTVRNQRSRFGSCSSTGSLNFNWQIIFFPKDKFCHLLLHEIAHLTHHNHSASFWQLLAAYDPNWRLNHRWIKKEGTKHYLC